MRHFLLVTLSVIALLAAAAWAKEQTELRDRVRDGVQRTDKDLENLVPRDKLDEQQRDRFDSALKDLRGLRDAVASGQWQGERKRLERAVENIDFVVKHAAISDGDRQLLGIDLYTLGVILDNWTP